MRKTQFQNQYYYHIYNRGVDKREIFMDEKDYIRFLKSMREFNRIETIESLYRLDYLRKKETKKEAELPIGSSASAERNFHQLLVDIICYSLLPNHYHLLLRQSQEKGVEKFLHKLGTSYTKYFNYKHSRSGSLFQGRYKSVPIKTDEYLLYLSAYINGNPEIHGIAKAQDWIWGSYQDYLGNRRGTLCNKKVILEQFSYDDKYHNYVDSVIKNSRERKDEIRKYFLE